MTFKGTGLDDLQSILRQFPRDFTIEDVTAYFEWPISRARQAIIAGQQTDSLRLLQDHRNGQASSGYAIYENVRWRREWITRAWGNREPNVDGERQQHS